MTGAHIKSLRSLIRYCDKSECASMSIKWDILQVILKYVEKGFITADEAYELASLYADNEKEGDEHDA